jgi:hypothetical protein
MTEVMQIEEKHLPIIDYILGKLLVPDFVDMSELYKKFPNKVDVNDAISIVGEKLALVPTGYGYKTANAMEAARQKESKYYYRMSEEQKSAALKNDMENTKLRLEVEKLKNELADYPKTKRRASISFWLSIAAIIISLAVLAVRFLSWRYPS